ncbi:hypothetical protein BZL30_5101 [Mycobacterium kansasii]|uniref:Uncharacterized protein n=1 Tax=Mycobacterium kansasii TaxID=1768 RepID=A0A1V3X4R0_MYCKA|nr:hypothetical protein BZL30_5101 [Mycobacterium kansasii]
MGPAEVQPQVPVAWVGPAGGGWLWGMGGPAGRRVSTFAGAPGGIGGEGG